MKKIKKFGLKNFLIVLFVCLLTISLAGCGIENSSSLEAAKIFTQAQIDGDKKVMEEINHSLPLTFPPQYVLSEASKNGYNKHKIAEFNFEQVNDTTINVYGPKDIGNLSLSFVKEDGKYYFESMGKVQKTQAQILEENKARIAAQEETLVAKKTAEDLKKQQLLDDRKTMLEMIRANGKVSGITDILIKKYPFQLTFTGFEESTGNFSGIIVYESDGSSNKILGNLSDSRLTFKEVESIKKGDAVLNRTYDLKPNGQGKFVGDLHIDVSGYQVESWINIK